ncbi:phage holin family protein [Pseudomonas sp. NFX15]|uniref:phage holin family protein n=1 Tax=Pseudomonas sp. NFX15 TaxID=2816958 RepID=UPI003BA1A286
MLAVVWLTGIAHLISAFRLACYQRNERHGWRDRLLISLCGGMFCMSGIDVLMALRPVSPGHAVVSVLSCALIVRSRGNVIALWKALKP